MKHLSQSRHEQMCKRQSVVQRGHKQGFWNHSRKVCVTGELFDVSGPWALTPISPLFSPTAVLLQLQRSRPETPTTRRRTRCCTHTTLFETEPAGTFCPVRLPDAVKPRWFLPALLLKSSSYFKTPSLLCWLTDSFETLYFTRAC